MDDPIAIVSLVVAMLGVIFTWRKFREDSLRRGEVLTWANEAIDCLEGLVIICILMRQKDFETECRNRLIAITFNSAALIEKGRIFFKNQKSGSFGHHKMPAYRGLRPLVLDPLVAAHQISVRLLSGEARSINALQCLAEDGVKSFVSLIQKEIGRDRTASRVAQRGGAGFNLDVSISKIAPDRIARIEELSSRDLKRYRTDPPPL
ncbi:hypothetical protein [Sphingopyxis sp. L1A2A]|uniref:hypothetical protein n=1 Tax=Sphingopyxis sp. L1A2A TaxID=2502247 RepID=UPI0010F90981|nr:hypothetical protein [Sphingopyxis sp. L1A2A]